MCHRCKDREELKDNLRERIKDAEAIMATWPDWKRNTDWLNNSPTVKVPREPIFDEDKIDY